MKTLRTHTCNELSKKHIDKYVTICGWVSKRRNHGGVIFIDLRDRYGVTQVLFREDDESKNEKLSITYKKASELKLEFVILCRGFVKERPNDMINKKIQTGEIELFCDDLNILSESETLPFEINQEKNISESLRLKYRYLDLRKKELQNNLITRHKVITSMRSYLNKNSFIEIETPMLYKSTPEGARDFVVPSRLQHGEFYALPQSPQMLKQLLMIGGMDRYYQIVKCFRDEDFRRDRQPEFSQLDIEASFINEESFLSFIEWLMYSICKDVLDIEISIPFKKFSYQESLLNYGSDKPDTRYDLKLIDISDIFSKSEANIFKIGTKGKVMCIALKNASNKFSRKDLDILQDKAKESGALGLIWIKIEKENKIRSNVAKILTQDEKNNLLKKLNLVENDLVISVSDLNEKTACFSLGALRLEIANKLDLIPKDKSKPEFLWVNKFPLLEYDVKTSRYHACHHPFTSPSEEFIDDLIHGKNLEKLESSSYDLVAFGSEVAGGSIRIHNSIVQDAMFKALGMTKKDTEEKFGFFIEALKYGTPPHGGIAIGIERLVSIILGGKPIREMIAFPKTQKGTCIMSGAPSEISAEQKAELGLIINKKIER